LLGIGIISVTPALTALLTPVVRKFTSKDIYGWLLTGLISLLFVGMLSYLPTITEAGPLDLSLPWVPQLGLSLAIYLDGLSLLMSLIVLGVGAVIVFYATSYFDDLGELSRFLTLLLPFMSAMLALVLAGNVLTLFIAWELTSILSFLLIGFQGEREDARRGALQALIITAGGGLSLLVGLVLLGTAAGSMQISQILSQTALHDHPWYSAFTILILIGCFTKSAQFPFHFWLPGAMSAPTPASAYLHSATMVKAGIYLLLRLAPALGDTILWQTALIGFGLLTMLMGAAFALRQRDLKAALAYSTISQLGALVALIGLPHQEGVKAALVGILAHSLYKASLFLVAGAVDHATETRDLNKLGGLSHEMPGWAAVAAIAGLSMAGVPPLLGFIAKENLLESLLTNPIALAVVVCSAALTVTMALILVWDVFWGAPKEHHHFHAPSRAMIAGPAILVGLSVLAGLLVEPLVTPLLHPIDHDIHLHLFAGFNTPFALSLFALASGLALFTFRGTWQTWGFPTLPRGTDVYQGIVKSIERVGDLVLRSQGGKLRYYLVSILVSVSVLQAAAGFSHLNLDNLDFRFNGAIDLFRIVLIVTALSAMVASIVYRKHLVAALLLGLSGYCVGGLFLIEPAPDVALVQFMVETLGTVLLIIMLTRIDAGKRQEAMDTLWQQTRAGFTRDVIISLVIGLGVGVFTLAAITSRQNAEYTTIATWHMENSVRLTGINDLVGAIVTDFRGMDTIIEITVFSVAALGVLTLITHPTRETRIHQDGLRSLKGVWNTVLRRRAIDDDEPIVHTSIDDVLHEDDPLIIPGFSTPLTRTIAQMVLPFAFLVALSQLLYGGDAPGDGFTAGVISGLGVALWYVVFGYDESRKRLQWLNSRMLIGCGLMLVLLNALFPLLIGQPFLAHLSFDEIVLPANLHLSSTLAYETGIFLTVLGCVSMVMEAIAYPREVEKL
jgi:NADH:ubiquinone oxidoreductase subunit 5 (subunit L)/multisubunit Na+/H+ antiporter MnhA subunit